LFYGTLNFIGPFGIFFRFSNTITEVGFWWGRLFAEKTSVKGENITLLYMLIEHFRECCNCWV